MTIDQFIKENETALKPKGAVVIEHKGFAKKTRFGEQVLVNQRFDADGDPLKRVFVKRMVNGKYVLPYEYSEAGWVEYKQPVVVKKKDNIIE